MSRDWYPGISEACAHWRDAPMLQQTFEALEHTLGQDNDACIDCAKSIACPSISIRPAVTGVSPTKVRSTVDLPEPDGPTSATTSPRSTASVTPFRTSSVP